MSTPGIFNSEFVFSAVVFITAAFTLTVQLFLCFKAKNKFLKFIPPLLYTVSTVVFCVISAHVNGWEGFGYLFFALVSFAMVIVCGISWLIYCFTKKQK